MIVQHDVPLADKTTLGIGGPAKQFARVESIVDLKDALESAERVLIIGGGSNLVVGDSGFDGLVVQMAIRGTSVDCDTVNVAAGESWDDFVAQMVAARRVGIECLSGIPGLVGATPMQNVGAYGQEVSDTITAVRVFDREKRELVTFTPAECKFGYRSSMFRHTSRYVIIDVTFNLPRGEDSQLRYAELSRALGADRAPLAAVRDTVIGLRRGKGMVVDPGDPDSRSAGSFFTNPLVTAKQVPDGAPQWPQPDGRIKVSAAWLIERAGRRSSSKISNVVVPSVSR
jgi:UDP-N-acetylmuramate dehydrogenase